METRRPNLTLAEFDEMKVIVTRIIEQEATPADADRLTELFERSRADVQAGYLIREDYVQGRPNRCIRNQVVQ